MEMNVQFLFIGNKSDLDDERLFDLHEAQQHSEQVDMRPSIATSALTGTASTASGPNSRTLSV
jgi:hypothetical protein